MRLIDETGKHIGVVNLSEALRMAQSKQLDVIEIQAQAKPPVVKIGDWTKFLYHQQKAQRKQKSQKAGKVKELRFGMKTFEHDLKIKAHRAEQFLAKQYKVKVQLYLRRYEKHLNQEARKKIQDFLACISTPIGFDQEPQRNPLGYTFIIRKSKEVPPAQNNEKSKDQQINSKTV